jgi:uncharacterized protein YvpB
MQHPLDCEAAALQIALEAKGIDVSQDWILGKIGADLRPPVLSGGVPVEWGDPYETFVGNVDGSMSKWTGYGVYYPPVTAAAQAAGAVAYGAEGWDPQQLYAQIAAGYPVVVWVPHLLQDDPTSTWTAWDGRSVWYALGEHAQVLVGYDMNAGTVTLDDDLDGQDHTLSMSLFQTRFAQWHSMAVVVGTGPPPPPVSVAATSSDSGQAVVSWTPPADAAAYGVTGYGVITYTDQRQPVGLGRLLSGAATTSITMTGLTDGTPLYFAVASVNSMGDSAAVESNSVTPLSGTAPGAAETAMSQSQYLLPNSDGTTWQVMDESNLAFTIDPSSTENVLLSANADLWTVNAGYNQDIGIQVTPGSGTPVLAAWKEAGGFAGTFSPNAAFVETVYPMSAGTTYTVQIVWKTNIPAIGATIAAGAGPIGSSFSPTRLTADVLPVGYQSVVSTEQYASINSNGSAWAELDAAHLVTTAFSPSSAESVVVSGNADLWTANAGYNQDLGIFVSVNGATPTLVAWKESGGFAGTFSPNAAFVQAVYPMTAGNSYVFSLGWKANKPANGTIYVGAGPIAGNYSPTRLTVYPLPADAALDQWQSVVSTEQYSSINSNGSTWAEMDPTNLATTPLTIGSGGAAETVLVSGNADLWTANNGYNQDLGIEVSVNGATPALVAWKESGGFAGTYSPNAAFVQAVYTLEPGNSYVFSLWWKTNKPANGTIYVGAGPISSAFSPTRLTVVPQM